MCSYRLIVSFKRKKKTFFQTKVKSIFCFKLRKLRWNYGRFAPSGFVQAWLEISCTLYLNATSVVERNDFQLNETTFLWNAVPDMNWNETPLIPLKQPYSTSEQDRLEQTQLNATPWYLHRTPGRLLSEFS